MRRHTKRMEQIYGAIIAITLVLCAVFVPMAFFSGSVGAIYRQFSLTLIMTILFFDADGIDAYSCAVCNPAKAFIGLTQRVFWLV